MQSTKRFAFCLLAFSFVSAICFGQSLKLQVKAAGIGFLSGYGIDLRNIAYAPMSLSANFSWKLALTSSQPDVRKGVFIQLEPAAGFVPRTNTKEWEYGLTPFVGFNFWTGAKFIPYLMIGSGPIYMTVKDISRQSGAWAFASAGAGGIKFYLAHKMYLNLQTRYRHISNAGIDNFFALIGLTWVPKGCDCPDF